MIFLLFQRRATWNPPDSARDLARSSPDSTDPEKYRPDLDQFGKISTPTMKLKTRRTWTRWFDHYYWSVSILFFTHPKNLGRVWVGHKPDPWTPLLGITRLCWAFEPLSFSFECLFRLFLLAFFNFFLSLWED